jgi:spermidine/putrescine transport system substrate-binding protein
MVKRIISVLCLLISQLIHAETLRVYTWEEYFSAEVLKNWETQTGHTVELVYFDNDEERDATLASQKTSNIDLSVVDQIATIRLGEEGIVSPLNQNEHPTIFKSIDAQWHQTCGNFGVPYLWGTLGVIYRTDKLDTPPTSWKELLEPKPELSGHIGLFVDYTDLLAPALFLDDQSINTENKDALKQAFERLKKALRHTLTFQYPLTFMDQSDRADELYLGLAYSGDQYVLNEKSGQEIWEYTTLQEGTITWLDCLAIVSKSSKKPLAYEFLNYLYQVEIMAKNSEEVYVAPPSAKAKAMQSKDFQNDLTVFPPDKLLKQSQQYKKLSTDSLYLRNRITSSLVKMHDSQ